MRQFPILVYRCPGAHWGPSGTTYDSVGVADDAELEQRQAQGYHQTLVAAVEAFRAPAAAPEPQTPDDAPPTRDEMMQQAEILGIKADKRWSDATLMGKIQEAMLPGVTDNDPI
jgi:hypothetical protein